MFRIIKMGAILIMVLGVLFISYEAYNLTNIYIGIGNQSGVIRYLDNNETIALTFDDGPHPEYTPEILNILEQNNIQATFFVLGGNAEEYPEIIERIKEENHSIGFHTYAHRRLPLMTEKDILKEISLFKNITQTDIENIRPPHGFFTQRIRRFLTDNGYTIALWSKTSLDWTQNDILIELAINDINSGDIILLHDTKNQTISLLPEIIEIINEKGLKAVAI